jgi:hypothetical protein
VVAGAHNRDSWLWTSHPARHSLYHRDQECEAARVLELSLPVTLWPSLSHLLSEALQAAGGVQSGGIGQEQAPQKLRCPCLCLSLGPYLAVSSQKICIPQDLHITAPVPLSSMSCCSLCSVQREAVPVNCQVLSSRDFPMNIWSGGGLHAQHAPSSGFHPQHPNNKSQMKIIKKKHGCCAVLCRG